MGVSPLIIGLTIVGLGTSAPEILVSIVASLEGNPDLAIGNALGSNIANIGLILGCTSLMTPILVQSKILKCDLPVLMVISIICYLLGFNGLGFIDGLIMLAGLAIFLFWLIYVVRKEGSKSHLTEQLESELPKARSNMKAWMLFGGGLLGLLFGSKILVWAAVAIAQHFNVSNLVIGLLIIAPGTSLPELVTAIASVLKQEHELALGNIIGSNVYNLLAVYALPGLIAPSFLAEEVLTRDFPVMLALTVVFFIFCTSFSKQPRRINRVEGASLLATYCGYQWVVFQGTTAV